MRPKNALVVYYVHNYNALKEIERCLRENKVSYAAVERESVSGRTFLNKDLIISVGGDGTFLKVARFAGRIPIFNVSSGPRYNEGFFARADAKDFCKKLKRILAGNYKITNLARLEGTFKSCADLIVAVNEIFVGSGQPQHTSRYVLEVNGKKEFQKSSGVIVATPAGSHAWAKSAGAKPLPLTSKKFLFIVREPYIGRLTPTKMHYGVLSKDKVVRIYSQTHKGIAVADSSQKAHRLADGEVIEIKLSKNNLRIIEF
jgi:NAD kinase